MDFLAISVSDISDATNKIPIFPVEFPFTSTEHFIEVLMEEIKPVVSEKSHFEVKVKTNGTLWHFRPAMIPLQRTKYKF